MFGITPTGWNRGEQRHMFINKPANMASAQQFRQFSAKEIERGALRDRFKGIGRQESPFRRKAKIRER